MAEGISAIDLLLNVSSAEGPLTSIAPSVPRRQKRKQTFEGELAIQLTFLAMPNLTTTTWFSAIHNFAIFKYLMSENCLIVLYFIGRTKIVWIF